jgi:predicted ATPase
MDDSPYPKWSYTFYGEGAPTLAPSDLKNIIESFQSSAKSEDEAKAGLSIFIQSFWAGSNAGADYLSLELQQALAEAGAKLKSNAKRFQSLAGFVIYSPENTSLRTFKKEGQIEPLGVNGEGVLKLLSVLASSQDKTAIDRVKDSLRVLGWFQDFDIVQGGPNTPSRMKINDRWLDEDLNGFDQKSANEGFLFLVFYFCLFASDLTPDFFAIDNIDASLNPKLCEHLVAALYKMSKESEKQVILTAHNPAVLDGLDLDDDDQRLFVISRGGKGQTRIRRVHNPAPTPGHRPLRLSEAFIRGSLGGLPEGF